MDGILEALAFALLIGGQFLAVVISRSKVVHAGPEERMQGTALTDGPEARENQSRGPLPLAGEGAIS